MKRGSSVRNRARIVGILYIVGTAAGMLSLAVTSSVLSKADPLDAVASHPDRVVVGALLVLLMGLALAMVPVLMFPILRRQHEVLAVGYVVFRGALETMTCIALATSWLVLVAVGRDHIGAGAAAASQSHALGVMLVNAGDPISAVTAIVFSLGALMFSYALYRSRLVPRWISGWGIGGAVLYLASGLFAVFSRDHGILMAPLGVQEMVMAVWLVTKGFSPGAVTVRSREEALAV